ncbi:MAG: insulinase family protein [Solirubrobacterales bacterium]
MIFKAGEKYNGFVVEETKPLNDIDSEGIIFTHEKTGAKLLYVKNSDDNKVFTISFRTPPKDSTGVAHILEHSVLCGSKKFPTKEPFVELAKGSLNTFLNAFTFPDKTMYPVASRNHKDFNNIMDVYLDAVFNPNIYRYNEIMMQEGWHYELESKDDELTYKGVVYNEMKGAFSSPESILFRKISESLFPDTAYGVESGGDPDVIPMLTQEQFTEFHKKYYHPSNSYLYLYGDMDIVEKLKFIDESYLSSYEKISVDSAIEIQKSYSEIKESTINYPISITEKEEDKTFLSLNFAVGKSTNPELYLAFEILEHMLLETPGSPLKKALIDSEIGKDVFGVYEGSILQPIFSIVVKNSNVDKKEQFKKVVYDTLNGLVTKGIDKKMIEASINIKEFQLREADYQGYPKGLIYSMKCMDSWLYDVSPFVHLSYENTLTKIKTALVSDYFEKIIKEYIIDNPHGSMLIVKPEKGLAEKKAEDLRKTLADYKAGLTEDEIMKIVDQTARLKERQLAEDSAEDLEKIPLLSIEDIDRNSEKIELLEKEVQGVKVLHCPVNTNKIAYVNLYFDADVIPMDQIPYLTILSSALGKLNTEKYDYEDLVKELNIYTGGVRYTPATYGINGSSDEFNPKFSVKSKVLSSNITKLFELLKEILTSTNFEDKKRLKEIIQETKSRMEMMMFDRGHIVVANHIVSYFSTQGKYEELTSGICFYKFIVELEKDFEAKWKEISDTLKEISRKIFNKGNIIVGVTSEDAEYEVFKGNFGTLFEKLSREEVSKEKYKFELTKDNEGFMTSGKVQYVAKAYNYIKLGYEYSGSMLVLKTINNYDYLWNRVRVQGGAYGGFSSFQRNGNMFYTSYRDPNLKETIKVYDEAGSYFKNFNTNSRQMTKYIIGTISDLDFPLSPAMKGERAVDYYFRNVSYEDIQRERLEVLETKVEDIRKYGDMIEDIMKQNYICVFGSEEKIKTNKDMFGSIINVFE